MREIIWTSGSAIRALKLNGYRSVSRQLISYTGYQWEQHGGCTTNFDFGTPGDIYYTYEGVTNHIAILKFTQEELTMTCQTGTIREIYERLVAEGHNVCKNTLCSFSPNANTLGSPSVSISNSFLSICFFSPFLDLKSTNRNQVTNPVTPVQMQPFCISVQKHSACHLAFTFCISPHLVALKKAKVNPFMQKYFQNIFYSPISSHENTSLLTVFCKKL